MSTHAVSTHLHINLDEYDAKIRTFVPYYEEMLDTAATAFAAITPTSHTNLLELGIGTGALSARCRALRPDMRITGIDADAEILAMAASRLGAHDVELKAGSFTGVQLPVCDVITSSLALHHVATELDKSALYRECYAALQPGGAMITADCYLPSNAELARFGMSQWKQFLELHYSSHEAAELLEAWSHEDTYVALDVEQRMMQAAGVCMK